MAIANDAAGVGGYVAPEKPEIDAAAKDLSQEIPVKDAIMVALAAGLGYGFDSYAVNIYGLLLPTIVLTLAIGPDTAGVIGSIFLIGYTVGTIGFGIAADRYGRKDTLGVSILIYGSTTALGGLGSNVIWFTLMRFFTGVGGAGELAVGAPYTCEMFRSRYRALGTGGIVFSLYSLGYIFAGFVALFVTPILGWRWPFFFAIVPAVLVFLFQQRVQESVRYVIEKADDKFAAAQAVISTQSEYATAGERSEALAKIEKRQSAEGDATEDALDGLAAVLAGKPEANRHGLFHVFGLIALGATALAAMFCGLLITRLPSGVAAVLVTGGTLLILLTLALFAFLQRGARHSSFWKHPVVRKRIGIGWILYTANAMGYWGVTTFLTTFMVDKFGVTATTAIWYAILFYGLQFFFSYLGTGLSDLIGRRPAGMLGAVIMIVCTLCAASASTFSVFVVFGAVQIAMLGWLWGLGDCYISELFPTSIRGACFGMSVGGGRVMSISAPFLVGAGIVAFGVTIPFLLSSGLWVLTFIGYLLGPETAKKPLEQLEDEFVAEAMAAT